MNMKENEAIKILKRDLQIQIENKALPDGIEAIQIAIQALEEVQQYRQSRTVEEYREAAEKQNTKEPAYDVDKIVEELNKIKKYNLNLADMMLDIQRNGTNRHFICLEDAIEIVKAGGKYV